MNLLKIMQEQKSPEFSHQKILGFYEEEFIENLLPYCSEHYWCDSESINVFNIVGTAHPDYIGLSWEEFIDVGKRMKHNLSLLASNPIYYTEKNKKVPTMYYVEIDGKLYVDGDGNHRSAIAKFYYEYNGIDPILHGVNLKKYTINHNIKNRVEDANTLFKEYGYSYILVKTQREKISREDTAGWMREYFKLTIVVKNIMSGKEITMTENNLQQELRKLRKKGLLSFLFNAGLFGSIL